MKYNSELIFQGGFDRGGKLLNKFYDTLGGGNSVSVIIISIAIILISGFLTTRITKLLKLPNVTAYIVTGIIIGPFCLNLIPESVTGGMSFLSDIALAFIAFGVGEYFRLESLKKNGRNVTVITLFEALLASLLIFILTFFILKLDLAFSVILSALASATAPASTMMTIRQTKANGDFVDTLLGAVALDDVVSLIAFSTAISLAMATDGGGVTFSDVALPVIYNIVLIAVGCLMGFALKLLMGKRSTDNRLIISVAFLFVICGIGAALDVSPLLGCMTMGAVYINATDDDRLFKQLSYFSPPILLLFFVYSGISFRLDALFDMKSSLNGVPLIVIGITYFIVRIIGKYAGAFIGCLITRKPKKTRNYLGLALIPQAGVAIGLVVMAARVIGGEQGMVLQTVILSSSILYEIIGPGCAKLALYLSGSYGKENSELILKTEEKTDTQTLREQLLKIEAEIARAEYSKTEEERAFNEAADDQYTLGEYMRRNRKFINRR